MGNPFAYFMLFFWAIFSIFLLHRLPPYKAVIIVLLGAFLLLPVRTYVDPPFLPALGKYSIATLSCLVTFFFIRKTRIGILQNKGLLKLLVIILLLSPFFTAMSNTDRVVFGSYNNSGLTMYDGLSLFVDNLLLIFPFFLGRQFIRSFQQQITLFRYIVISAILYSILILIEIRFSPQLHKLFYGYHPHLFAQQMRFDGFRPMVFMGHGLLVSFFVFVALLSGVALFKNNIRLFFFKPNFITTYLFAVLIMCKSVASIVYGIVFIVITRVLSTKKQIYIALILSIMAFSYPLLQMQNLFPDQLVLSFAEKVSEDRAQSMLFRFKNEGMLLERADEKLLFGWGGWGRGRIYNQNGDDISTTDGNWIIQYSQKGLVGFIAVFGIILYTVVSAVNAHKKSSNDSEKSFLAIHALIVSALFVDQLPNSSLNAFYWLMIGALLGRAENILTANYLTNQHH